MNTYDIIYCDPPWDYRGSIQHNGKETTGSARFHYPCMTHKELLKFNLPETNKDALMFMWTSSPHLKEAIHLGEAWGFKYITIAFVWDKQKVNPSYYTMSQIEICLVFKKGRIPQPRGSRNERQFLSELRGRHSAITEAIAALEIGKSKNRRCSRHRVKTSNSRRNEGSPGVGRVTGGRRGRRRKI